MREFRFWLLMMSLLSALSLAGSTVFADDTDNGTERGGGDPYVEEFKNTARKQLEILELWREKGIDVLPSLKVDDFKSALKIPMESQERVYLNPKKKQNEVFAAVERNKKIIKRILISRKLMDDLPAGPSDKKSKLVLHEFFRVMELPDENYESSNEFWKRVDKDKNVAAYRTELLERLQNLSRVLLRRFNLDFMATKSGVAAIKASSDYYNCTKPGSNMSKSDDLAACLMVVKAFEKMSAKIGSLWVEAFDVEDRISTQDDRFNAFIQRQADETRRHYAIQAHDTVVNKYNQLIAQGNADVSAFMKGLNSRCPGQLNSALVCVFSIVEQVEKEPFAVSVAAKRGLLKKEIDYVTDRAKNYDELY